MSNKWDFVKGVFALAIALIAVGWIYNQSGLGSAQDSLFLGGSVLIIRIFATLTMVGLYYLFSLGVSIFVTSF